jgi:hypothetical protein
VLVTLTIIASQFGYLDFATRPMGRIEAGPWAPMPLPVPTNLLVDTAVAPTNPATVYICTAVAPVEQTGERPSGGLLFWSTQDAGQHWFTLPLIGALGYACALGVAPDDPNTVIAVAYRDPACTMSAVYLTHDSGAHWHQLGQLPGVPYDLHYCSLWITGTSRHLLLRQWYERNDVKQDDPQRYGSAMYHSEDDGATWHSGKLVGTGMGYPVFLADGTTLLVANTRVGSPTAGDIALWTSQDAGTTWDP